MFIDFNRPVQKAQRDKQNYSSKMRRNGVMIEKAN